MKNFMCFNSAELMDKVEQHCNTLILLHIVKQRILRSAEKRIPTLYQEVKESAICKKGGGYK